MKTALSSLSTLVAAALVWSLVACGGSAQNAEPKTATSSAALTSAEAGEPSKKTAAEEWAEKKVAAETAAAKGKEPKKAESADPLAMNSELEESSIPNVEITPAKQVRGKSPAELNAAMGVVKSASSVDGAAKKLTERLGKPSFVESPKGNDQAKRRIWVAASGSQCQRLVLEMDGSVELETASKTEWRMLSASARQNPCTGEIKRGISK